MLWLLVAFDAAAAWSFMMQLTHLSSLIEHLEQHDSLLQFLVIRCSVADKHFTCDRYLPALISMLLDDELNRLETRK